jgi:hypothetical protein
MARYGQVLTDAQWEKICPWLPKRPRRPAWRQATCGRLQSARTDSVDSAQRSSLAGFTRRVSFTGNLLEATSGLGRARNLAHHLACIPGGTEPTRATRLERIVSGRQFCSSEKRSSKVGQGEEVDGGGRRRGCPSGKAALLGIPERGPARGRNAHVDPGNIAADGQVRDRSV